MSKHLDIYFRSRRYSAGSRQKIGLSNHCTTIETTAEGLVCSYCISLPLERPDTDVAQLFTPTRTTATNLMYLLELGEQNVQYGQTCKLGRAAVLPRHTNEIRKPTNAQCIETTGRLPCGSAFLFSDSFTT